MRQLGDLLAWMMVVVVLAAVVYFTPKLAEYVSSDNRPPLVGSSLAYSARVAPDLAY